MTVNTAYTNVFTFIGAKMKRKKYKRTFYTDQFIDTNTTHLLITGFAMTLFVPPYKWFWIAAWVCFLAINITYLCIEVFLFLQHKRGNPRSTTEEERSV